MWINAREQAPKTENVYYLVALDSGLIMTLSYCDGWNCHREWSTGKIDSRYEMHDVAAWRELPPLPSWVNAEVWHD